MVIKAGGNVGIGTTTPGYTLDVSGSLGVGGRHYLDQHDVTLKLGSTGLQNIPGMRIRQRPAQTVNSVAFPGNDYILCGQFNDIGNDNSGVDGNKFIVKNSGNVGIGTTTPSYPLHVALKLTALQGPEITSHYFLNNPNGTNTIVTGTYSGNASTGQTFSTGNAYAAGLLADQCIKGDGYITTGKGFIAESDRRIKTQIVDVVDDEALIMFRKLKPKTYGYKDTIIRGNGIVYGFIAQEVGDVVPYSIIQETQSIPNIYETANFVTDTLTLTFNTADLSRDASGALFPKLKLKTKDLKDEFVNIVEVIDEHTIKVDKDLTEWGGQLDASGQVVPGDKIFVYGQEVNDFHNLNKDAIWTVATAALQEVDRQLQAEKQKTAALQTTFDALLERVVALEQKSAV